MRSQQLAIDDDGRSLGDAARPEGALDLTSAFHFNRQLTYCGCTRFPHSGQSAREYKSIFSSLIIELAEFPELRERVLTVLHALPSHVQQDFVEDPRFRVTIDNFVPGQGWTLWMPTPGPIGSGTRCVVLRPKLSHCAEAFAHYVIAHEFAHAFLRNGPWGEILDVEEAADALAATWGFRRPVISGLP